MSQEAFVQVVLDLVTAVDESFKKPKLLPAYILLYSTIDILASLVRPISCEDTSGGVFKSWVKKYMIAEASAPWNEEDIWGARCGLLHTYTVQSRSSRERKARELSYINTTDREAVAHIQREIDPQAERKVMVCLPDLIASFINGVERFTTEVKNNPELSTVVFHHSAKLIVHDQVRITPS